jgi:iron-sulfur cluster repair protein YtfE (RIC family)
VTRPTNTVDTRGMLLIHRVIRREIGALPRLFRQCGGNPDRAARLSTHAVEMLEFLHTHHSGEDELLWPVLRAKVPLHGALVDRMESEHHQIEHAVESLRRDLSGWDARADGETSERMAACVESMHGLLETHLATEEAEVLPLVARHFSQGEWDVLAKHGFGAIPGNRRLVMLGHILEEADPDEQQHMLQKVPPPARIAFNLVGRRQHAREVAEIRG